jgi:hypothetical protein
MFLLYGLLKKFAAGAYTAPAANTIKAGTASCNQMMGLKG